MNSNNRPVPQQRDSTTNCYYTTGSAALPTMAQDLIMLNIMHVLIQIKK